MPTIDNKGSLLLEKNDIVKTENGSTYTIEKYFKEGKDGILYIGFKQGCTKKYVFKIYRRNENFEYVKSLYNHRIINKNIFPEFALPIDLFVFRYGNKFIKGIVSDYVGENDLASILGKPKKKGMLLTSDPVKKCTILKKICTPLYNLHKVGWAYSDISSKNIRIDGNGEKIYFIDCDAIRPHDQVIEKVGTTFFMAPEVAYGKDVSGINVDRFAIAQLIFRSLIGEFYSPYSGKTIYETSVNVDHMSEFASSVEYNDAEKLLKFIFDPIDKTNSLIDSNPKGSIPSKLKEKNEQISRVLSIYRDYMPTEIHNLFDRAFKNPFDKQSQENRPTALQWIKVFDKVIDGSICFSQRKYWLPRSLYKIFLPSALNINNIFVSFYVRDSNGLLIALYPAVFTSGEHVKNGLFKFEAIPYYGYQVKAWYKEEELLSQEQKTTLELTLLNDVTISVEFEKKHYTVKYNVSEVSADSIVAIDTNRVHIASGDKIAHGESIIFGYKMNNGYVFENWVLNGNNILTDVLVIQNVDSDIEVSAVFKIQEFLVNFEVKDGIGGKLEAVNNNKPVSTGVMVPFGSIIQFITIPMDGYQVSAWNNSANNSNTFSMLITSPISITVQFERRGENWFKSFAIMSVGGIISSIIFSALSYWSDSWVTFSIVYFVLFVFFGIWFKEKKIWGLIQLFAYCLPATLVVWYIYSSVPALFLETLGVIPGALLLGKKLKNTKVKTKFIIVTILVLIVFTLLNLWTVLAIFYNLFS